MASSIFGNSPAGPDAVLDRVRSMMGNMNPQSFAEQMMRQNPQFRQFVENNREKAPSRFAGRTAWTSPKFQSFCGKRAKGAFR